MATLEHWQNWKTHEELNNLLYGKPDEDRDESVQIVRKIFNGTHFEPLKGGGWKLPYPTGRVLEIGCGTGRLLREVAPISHVAVGVDWCPQILQASTIPTVYPNVVLVLNDGVNLPFPSNSFGFVFTYTCLQHIIDPEKVKSVIAEAYRVLEPGGMFSAQTVLGNPNDDGRYDGTVYPSATAFAEMCTVFGFNHISAETEGEWIWLRARK